MAGPTMEDVAARAGVSRSLVSLVMRGSSQVSPHRRAAVLEAADELGYRPNAHARNLASSRTRTVGVLLSDLHNPFFAEVYDGVEEGASEAGIKLLASTGGRRPAGEQRVVETFLEQRVDGIILAGARLASADIVAAAEEVPVALVTRTVRSRAVDWVSSDDVRGAALAVEHLLELGHRRIAHIDGGRGAGAASRRTGYSQAMTKAGLGDAVTIVSGDYTEGGGAAATDRLLRSPEPPTAIFAANDLCAAGVLGQLDDLGLDVPADVSVVGYDNTALAGMRRIGLTTIDQHRLDMGRQAMHAVLDRIGNRSGEPLRSVLPPSLVVRTTSGPPPPTEPPRDASGSAGVPHIDSKVRNPSSASP